MILAGIAVGALGLYSVSRLDTLGLARPSGESVVETEAETTTSRAMSAAATVPPDEPAIPGTEPIAPAAVAQETDSATSSPTPPAILPQLEPDDIAALQALPPSETWLANALPAVDSGGWPMVAIVIDDVGVNRANAPGAIGLPAPVTLSFMSYAEGLADMTQQARARGHELMLHLPMEPVDPTNDPGPHGLRLSQSAMEIEANVHWALARFDGYIGVNNHMGSLFTRSTEGMALVLAELRRRGLMFLDSRTVADSAGARVASELGVPNLARDVFLDNDPAAAAIVGQLAELERIARERGYAIGIGHPYPSTLAALNAWLPTLQARGIVAVPVSTILRQKLGVAG